MRVALVDPSLFTFPYDQALARGLINVGHEVTLYSRRPGAEDGVAEDVPLDPLFYRFSHRRTMAALPAKLRLGLKGVDHLGSMMRLLTVLRRVKPEIIHFQWLALPPADQLLLRLFRQVAPLVMTVHDTDPFNGNPASKLQVLGFRQCLEQFDRLIVHTAQGERRLQQIGLPAERIVQRGMGPLYPSAPDIADPMTGRVTFMLFGKIKPYKGADVLVKAFAAMPNYLRGQSRVRIVGKPYMDLAPLQELIAAHGLDVTIEPGFVDDAAIATLFGPGMVAMFPYREIEASAVMLQAMACGRPVIASRLGSFAELFRDGVHGHLVTPGDVADLSAAMSHIVEDRAFAAASAAAVRVLADQTPSWEEIAQQTVQTYSAAVAASLPHRSSRKSLSRQTNLPSNHAASPELREPAD